MEDNSVLSLRPKEPILLFEDISIENAAIELANAHADCALVVNNTPELVGIITAKDLAYMIGGSKKKGKTVSDIMTSNPICAKKNTLAQDALNLMVVRGFRHLPIVDGLKVVGVLDITRCYQVAVERLEKILKSNDKDKNELIDSSHSNWLGSSARRYLASMKNLLNGPKLSDLLDEKTCAIYCQSTDSVEMAAIAMRRKKTTAVLVRDSNERVVGIITSKDVVARVFGKGINVKTCKVESVMTINPAFANKSTLISKALRQMLNGKYLNLPVVDDNEEIVGIVDVIRLTHFALNQIQTLESINEDDELDEFWNDATEDDIGDVSVDEVSQFDLPQSKRMPKRMNSLLSLESTNEKCFFKFRLPGGRFHRLSYTPDDGLNGLLILIWGDLSLEERQEFDGKSNMLLSYHDDGDMIIIGTDTELSDCVKFMGSKNKPSVELVLHDKQVNLSRGTVSNGGSNGGNILLPISMFALSAAIIFGVIMQRNQR